MGLGDIADIDPWEEPTKADYEEIDKDLLTTLIMSRFDLRPIESTAQFSQIRSTVRWYLAFDIEGWTTRRRRFAQHRVAEESGIEYTAVQDKVRGLYDEKAGRESAQTLFEDELKDIEDAYESHLNAR